MCWRTYAQNKYCTNVNLLFVDMDVIISCLVLLLLAKRTIINNVFFLCKLANLKCSVQLFIQMANIIHNNNY